MPTNVDSTETRLVPSLRYRDVGAAIDWLCSAFGFEQHRVVTGVDGTILQAQLTLGSDMIMLLPVRGTEPDKLPEEIGGAEMQSCYFVVDDADHHHRNAKSAGADILDIKQYEYGGRGYSCRDPEGHIWNFGTYNPRQEKPAYDPWRRKATYGKRVHRTSLAVSLRFAAILRDKLNPPVIVAAMVAAVVAAATVGWMLVALPHPGASGKEKRLASRTHQAAEEAPKRATPPPAAEPAQVMGVAFAALARQRAVEATERPARQTPELAREPGADEAAERAPRQTAKLDQETSAKEAAERTAPEALRQRQSVAQKTTDERSRMEARKSLASASQDADAQLARERVATETAVRAGKEARKRLVEAQPAKEPLARQFRNADAQFLPQKKSAPGEVMAPAALPQSPERDVDAQFWDCQPSPPTGQIVCRPQEKKPAPGEVMAPPAQNANMSSLGPTKKLQQSQERDVDAQLWDCQPRPPTGQIVCRPIIGNGKR